MNNIKSLTRIIAEMNTLRLVVIVVIIIDVFDDVISGRNGRRRLLPLVLDGRASAVSTSRSTADRRQDDGRRRPALSVARRRRRRETSNRRRVAVDRVGRCRVVVPDRSRGTAAATAADSGGVERQSAVKVEDGRADCAGSRRRHHRQSGIGSRGGRRR